jgi:hypothetical protein
VSELADMIAQYFIDVTKVLNPDLVCTTQSHGTYAVVDVCLCGSDPRSRELCNRLVATLLTGLSVPYPHEHTATGFRITLQCLNASGEEWLPIIGPLCREYDDPSWDPSQIAEELAETMVKCIGEIRD